ncbi:MAG: DUF1223 domain-containing protein [Alphaproteobacteria bacterium]|nr:MAG: DUF1223 domain-containing protein [Alphaproteobacteria bacterium]
MTRSIMFFAAAFLSLCAFASFAADTPVKATATLSVEKDHNAIVVELFTSQSCSSCPPAQAYLGDLAKRTDVIALEMHVDYWDHYKPILNTNWKDPLSSPVWTQRQGDYARLLMNGDNVYTPQMIIDGKLQDAGNRRGSVNSLIEQAKSLRTGRFKVSPRISPKGETVVTIEGPGQSKPVRVVMALLQKEVETDIRAGENKGDKQVSHNVVKEMLVIGTWDGGKQSYKVNVPAPKDNDTCAVILQDPETMHILAGGVCGL